VEKKIDEKPEGKTHAGSGTTPQTPQGDDQPVHEVAETQSRKASRLERLKSKVKRMQGKNPDIYPMW